MRKSCCKKLSGYSFICVYVLFSAINAFAQFGENEQLSVRLISGKEKYSVNDTVVLALKCFIQDKYHLYGNPMGPGIGKPLNLAVQSVDGLEWIEARATSPVKFTPEIGGWVWAYEKEAVFFLVGVVNKKIENTHLNGKLTLDGLICHDACIPISKDIEFSIEIGNSVAGGFFEKDIAMQKLFGNTRPMPFALQKTGGQSGKLVDTGISEGLLIQDENLEWAYEPVAAGISKPERKSGMGLIMALLLAFCAGVILNAMPCVLPVLGIKILSFSQGLSGGRKEAVLRSLVFAAGMISVFLALASLAAFANFSWGQQFQNPYMLAGIVSFMVVFAMGMFDVYTIILPSGLSNMGRSDSHSFSSEFTRGIFATVLATPCSGPLLGAVLAWTLTQPPFVIYAVFTAIGAGMASPYILLSSSRRVAKIIPKPGQWMNDFKHVMGFLLIGFAVYLMSGLTREMILVTTMLCLGLIFAAGIYGRFAPFGASFARRFWVAVFAVAVCVSIGYSGFSLFALKTGEEKWEPFSQDLLMRAHDDGRPVLANFTAQWCMNCQYNKHHTLNSKEVQKLATEKDILLMEVDLTNNSPVAEGLLHHLGSRSVPFLALFPGNDPYHPIIMRDIIGKRQLLDVLEKLD